MWSPVQAAARDSPVLFNGLPCRGASVHREDQGMTGKRPTKADAEADRLDAVGGFSLAAHHVDG
jgi:hypothetical protein